MTKTTKISPIGGYSVITTIPRPYIEKFEKERGKTPTSITWTENKKGNLTLTLNSEE